MEKSLIFNFKSDVSRIDIPTGFNNPFGTLVTDISKVAAREFQEFIASESVNWGYDFMSNKGKMFGVLVVRKEDGTLGYLGTVSGKLPGDARCAEFVPSVFDDSIDDYFIIRGMKELTAIGDVIKATDGDSEIEALKEKRKQKSVALQQRLFENYNFLNLSGKEENLLEIFKASLNRMPPAAAGECAGPKLLQYAIVHQLQAIALSEFWWGGTTKSKERVHQGFYPACENKCRPILEYMLEDNTLFNNRNIND